MRRLEGSRPTIQRVEISFSDFLSQPAPKLRLKQHTLRYPSQVAPVGSWAPKGAWGWYPYPIDRHMGIKPSNLSILDFVPDTLPFGQQAVRGSISGFYPAKSAFPNRSSQF